MTSSKKTIILIASMVLIIIIIGYFKLHTLAVKAPAPSPSPSPVSDYRASDPNDPIYKELITTDVVNNEEQLSPGAKIAIIAKHQNNIVELNVYNPEGAGHALWVQKINGTWTKLFSGQQYPDCPLLEKAGIEAGVTCLNPNSATECVGDKNNSDCYNPKTK